MRDNGIRQRLFGRQGRHFEDLSDAEILAVAIASEEEATQAYTGFAEKLREEFPDTARMFTDMAAEEAEHRRMLIDMFKLKFGEQIPQITAADVSAVRFTGGRTLRPYQVEGVEWMLHSHKQKKSAMLGDEMGQRRVKAIRRQ